MERREEHCRIAKQTILTTHPSGLQTRVSVELTKIECKMERTTKSPKKIWDSPFLPRRFLSSSNNTPVLSRRSDVVTEGRLSQQCTPVMKRRMEDGSPASSPLLSRREPCDVDNSIISGWLKYRDNKRWKSRWGVITKLSPAADCLHLQLYRSALDAARSGGGEGPRRTAWAALSLQHYLALESGFTLDREAHTLALVCQDHVIVLAFETRERLIAWQLKVSNQLGASRSFLVVVPTEGTGGAEGGLRTGPARLHVRQQLVLLAGTPPALQAVWELQHLRRYGIVEGRFAWEAGARSGAPGAYCVACDRPRDIATAIDDALRDMNTKHSKRTERDKPRSSTRLSDINTMEPSDTASAVYEENFYQDDGLEAAYWSDQQGVDDFYSGQYPNSSHPWSAPQVTLQRCGACLSHLGGSHPPGALSTPTHFNPAWTMEGTTERGTDSSSNNPKYLMPRTIRKTLESCQCNRPPERPPKGHLEKKPPAPLPLNYNEMQSYPRVGPYENYDIPKPAHFEQVTTSDYYDTPKRIKQALTEDLFQVTNSSSPGSLVLKKNCGCILKFGSKKKPLVVECEENLQPVDCPCLKVTNWANNLISLPFCKKDVNTDKVITEVLTPQKAEKMAIYATVDISRKINRNSSSVSEKDAKENIIDTELTNNQNMDPEKQEFEGPFTNYENLEFALSLEYYENAKDLLKKAGVTQIELDALSANIERATTTLPNKTKVCLKCGPSQKHKHSSKSDEYLLMQPLKDMKREQCPTIAPSPGYTPMCPNQKWSQSLKYPLQKYDREDTIEKYHSIPTLNGSSGRTQTKDPPFVGGSKEAIQQRSSSVDSTKLLEDLKEFDSSVGSHMTSSSLETLRNLTVEHRRSSTPGDNECEDCESSVSEKKISAASSSNETPPFRNKDKDSFQTQSCVNVPCKGGNRDSSSSNDSGVSSCSMKHATEFPDYEMPLTSAHKQYQAIIHRRMRGNLATCHHSSLPRKSKSSDLLRDQSMQLFGESQVPTKSSSAEAEVPVLPPKQFKVLDGRSMSSGTSDMSDYIETLSLTSSHSSTDTATTNTRVVQAATSTLRPRSGKEYHVTHHYTHLP